MMITEKKKKKGMVSRVRGAAGSLIQAGVKAQRQMEEWIKSVLTKADAIVKPYLKSLQSIGWRDSPVIKHLLAVSQRVIPSRFVRKEAAAKTKRQLQRSAPPARSSASANEMLVCAPSIKQMQRSAPPAKPSAPPKPLPHPPVSAYREVVPVTAYSEVVPPNAFVKATSESVEGLIRMTRKASSENLESLIKGVGEGVGNILDRASPVKGVANIFGQQESNLSGQNLR